MAVAREVKRRRTCYLQPERARAERAVYNATSLRMSIEKPTTRLNLAGTDFGACRDSPFRRAMPRPARSHIGARSTPMCAAISNRQSALSEEDYRSALIVRGCRATDDRERAAGAAGLLRHADFGDELAVADATRRLSVEPLLDRCEPLVDNGGVLCALAIKSRTLRCFLNWRGMMFRAPAGRSSPLEN